MTQLPCGTSPLHHLRSQRLPLVVPLSHGGGGAPLQALKPPPCGPQCDARLQCCTLGVSVITLCWSLCGAPPYGAGEGGAEGRGPFPRPPFLCMCGPRRLGSGLAQGAFKGGRAAGQWVFPLVWDGPVHRGHPVSPAAPTKCQGQRPTPITATARVTPPVSRKPHWGLACPYEGL